MANKKNRYKEMERIITMVLIGDGAAFALYLLFSGLGVGWLKAILTIAMILVSIAGLVFLYLNGELLKQRSLWMSAGFAAVLLCLLVSLICNYPSPNRVPQVPDRDTQDPVGAVYMDVNQL